jgi:hypothetical protein
MILNIFCGAGESARQQRRDAGSKEPPVNILTVNLLLSTFVFWIAASSICSPACTRASRATSCCRSCCCMRCAISA